MELHPTLNKPGDLSCLNFLLIEVHFQLQNFCRGCGQRGDSIQLPESFFTNWNRTVSSRGSPAKLFVKEWAKFRYGVFDEHGFADDPLYPNFYKVEDKFLIIIIIIISTTISLTTIKLYPN